MSLLSKDAILKASDVLQEKVKVPEWAGSVMVRGLTGAQRDAYESSLMIGKGKSRDVNLKNARAKLVVLCVVDEDGRRLFTDADVAALGDKSAAALQRIFDAAQKLSGLSDQDIEELTGESNGQSDGSVSA